MTEVRYPEYTPGDKILSSLLDPQAMLSHCSCEFPGLDAPLIPKPNLSKVLKLGSPKYLENCGPWQLPPGLGQLGAQAMVNVLHNPFCNRENRVWVVITPQLCHI